MTKHPSHPLDLPEDCFSPVPGRRLTAIRRHLRSLSKPQRGALQERISQEGQFYFPHCAYTIPAWGLIVLPGPGAAQTRKKNTAKESDSSFSFDPYCDWTPGLGEPSLHFWKFPDYLEGNIPREKLHGGGQMWPKLRKGLRNAKLPEVDTDDRDCFACWGLVNLTTEHARSEADRGKDTKWNTKPLQRIIEICRPSMLISCCERFKVISHVQDALRKQGAVFVGEERTYVGDRSGRLWNFHWWKMPWGKIRVGKMHTHPSYWGEKVSEILSEEAEEMTKGYISIRSKLETVRKEKVAMRQKQTKTMSSDQGNYFRLIRFKGDPYSRRSYVTNRFLVQNLGKTKEELEEAIETWPEKIPTSKHGDLTLKELLSKQNQTFEDMVKWTTGDFYFFSWENDRLTLNAENLEVCTLVDRLIESKVPMGDNQGKKVDTIVWAWKKGKLEELRKLAEKKLKW